MNKIIVLVIGSILSMQLFANDSPAEDDIEYRTSVMTAIRGHNNAIKLIVTEKVSHTGKLVGHIDAIRQLFDELDSIFPAGSGSDSGKTNAKNDIWEKPEKFNRTISEAKQALDTFRGIATQGDLSKTAVAFKEFGKTSCGSCHKSFKKKDD